jgi:hypothetical protein
MRGPPLALNQRRFQKKIGELANREDEEVAVVAVIRRKHIGDVEVRVQAVELTLFEEAPRREVKQAALPERPNLVELPELDLHLAVERAGRGSLP